ncbi:hypothetical protein C8F04DRAFT_1062448 [Mycena alexandri]|uniref:Uncharacterized protein n=1 Tax=Mycena alexandri TaxID=1745969 RepID=A0AAD6TI35_9AGAR|nr:hypothetical protein C8F04DRAFT_1062448 [Mycena alexandri]
MESAIYDPINLMDVSPASQDTSQFLPPGMPAIDAFAALPDATMPMPLLGPAPYIPAPIAPFTDYPPQYPMMDQTSDIDLLARAPTQMQPPSAAIHGAGASYNLNNTSSLASALDPGGVVPVNRSRANTLTSQTLPPFASASFAPVPVLSNDAPIVQIKQEDVAKERVVGNMLRNIAHVIKTAGDACHQHQAARSITPGDEQKTRQVIAQINDLLQGMGLPTTPHADISRKRHAGDLKDGEQPPVKKILKPEPEDVNLSALPVAPVAQVPASGTFVRTHTASRSQPSSRPHTPPLTVKPVPSNFRPPPVPTGFPVFTVPNPALEHSHRFGHGPGYRHQHSRSMGSIPREAHASSGPSAPAGRMGRTGYFLPEHGWSTKGVSPKSAPTLATFTYPNPMEPIAPVSVMPSSATEVVDEEEEDNDAEDDNDTASPSGSSLLGYSDGLSSGSDIPQEYRTEVDRVFIQYLNRICSNLDAADNKGDPIHQQLMAKKMQKLDESTDFRPFKFRIQAFTAAFLEELAEQGYPEEKIPMKKVRNYLWRQPLILRFNEDGKKAKSKGNHIWNVEAKKLGDGLWDFRPFHRKIAGNPPGVAYCGLLWKWQPRIWDPQACWQNVHVQYSSPDLPAWLQWKDDVLYGTPPTNAESCDITTHAKFTLDGQEGILTRTFYLNIAPLVSPENPFPTTFGQRPSITPRRTVSESTIQARSIPRTPALVTDEEDEARVKMVLEGVVQRLTQETQPPGELSRQKHLLEQTVNACLDDYQHSGNAPEGTHELAVAGQNVVAQAAEYIVRKAAPPGVVLPMPGNTSAMQNVNTEELVETTKDAIAEAVNASRGTSEIDELSILLIACRFLDGAMRPSPPQQWIEHSPPTVHMPPPPAWYVPVEVAYV